MTRIKDKPQATAFKSFDGSVVLLLKNVEDGSSEDKEFIAQVKSGMERSQGSLYTNLAVKQARNNAKIKIFKERLVNQDDF